MPKSFPVRLDTTHLNDDPQFTELVVRFSDAKMALIDYITTHATSLYIAPVAVEETEKAGEPITPQP